MFEVTQPLRKGQGFSDNAGMTIRAAGYYAYYFYATRTTGRVGGARG